VIDHGDRVHDLREGDPHVWLDPLQTIAMTWVIESFLDELDPDGTESYVANGAAYRAEIEALHAEMSERLAPIPEETRKLVVFHDAYTCFAARYGFEVIGIVLNNPSAEPSAKEFAELATRIEAAGVTVIFAEPQFNSAILDGIAAETGVEIGELLTDAFAGNVDNYLDLMRFNLASLTRHLA
jgi:ABC-type Zn uptake system ZnuABC Zn-binding protein ZnuA